MASKSDSAIERAIASGEPAHVAKYAFQLAQAFNNFYHGYQVLSEENREKRVFLLWMTGLRAGATGAHARVCWASQFLNICNSVMDLAPCASLPAALRVDRVEL